MPLLLLSSPFPNSARCPPFVFAAQVPGEPRARVAPAGCPGAACPAAFHGSREHAAAQPRRARRGPAGRAALRPPRSGLRTPLAARPGPARRPGGPGSPAGRGLAGPVQLRAGRPGRLPRLGCVLPGTAGPGLGLARLILRGPLGLGDPCLRGLLRGHGVLLGGSLRRQRPGQPGIGLLRRSARLSGLSLGLLGAGLQGGPGLLCRRDLRSEPGPQPGLVPRGAAGLAPAAPWALSSARAASAASRARAASCPAFLARDSAAATRSSAARRAWAICARAPRPPARRQPRRQRPASRASACCGAARASPASASARARRRQNADPGRPGSAARPHRDRAGPAPGAAGTPSAPYAAPRSPGPAARSTPAPPLRCPRLRLILTARIRASEEALSGPDHRQAPFSADQHSVTGPGRPEPVHPGTSPRRAEPTAAAPAWHGLWQG